MEILDEVRIMNNYNKDCVNTIVSIGTGKNNKVSRWTKSKRPGSRHLNYLNFAKKWASESETTHQKMLKMQKTLAFDYFRFNVEEGLDRMKLDEWHARGSSRVTVGKCVDSTRRKFKRTKHVERDDLDQREKPAAANDFSSTLSQASLHSRSTPGYRSGCNPEIRRSRSLPSIQRRTWKTQLYSQKSRDVQKY